jgi:hypothetical protein
MRQPQSFQIFALSGGGFLGLYTAEIWARLERQAGRLGQCFDLIAGSSVGGILAIGVGWECRPTECATCSGRTASGSGLVDVEHADVGGAPGVVAVVRAGSARQVQRRSQASRAGAILISLGGLAIFLFPMIPSQMMVFRPGPNNDRTRSRGARRCRRPACGRSRAAGIRPRPQGRRPPRR